MGLGRSAAATTSRLQVVCANLSPPQADELRLLLMGHSSICSASLGVQMLLGLLLSCLIAAFVLCRA
eukprot:6406308-Amphidinium_carterae.1